jgi:betaine-aldehyde dehydrogenase
MPALSRAIRRAAAHALLPGTGASGACRGSPLTSAAMPSLVTLFGAHRLQAVEWVMFGAFWTNGQICSSTSRILVHSK